MLLHMPQILNDVSMVGDAIDNVNSSELGQSQAGKFIALKTPRNVFIPRTLAKAVPALLTRGEHGFGETPIAANVPDGNTGFLGYPA